MKCYKKRLAIDAIAIPIYIVQEKWREKILAVALFMDMKDGFDYVFKVQFITYMLKVRVDGDLMTWTSSFLIN